MGRKKEAAPKAYQVRISTNALQNIDEITGYIAFINHQPLNAIKVGDAIFATIDRIEVNPFAFKECVDLPNWVSTETPSIYYVSISLPCVPQIIFLL